MPRKARIDATGAVHHIIVRGIERKSIFKDDQDYQDFIDRLGNILTETSTPCFAWTLMPNHAHLLLRTGLAPISTVMGRLLTGYAQHYNRRHKRHGHLFQNRFKSFLCEEDPYLLELVRYIHLNPLRARLVKDLQALADLWKSGHSGLMGKYEYQWQNTEYVLGLFANSIGAARKSYAEYVQKGVSLGRRPELVGGGLIRSAGGWSALKALKSQVGSRIMGDERILGCRDFVESVLLKADEQYERRALISKRGWDLDRLATAISKYFDVGLDTIRSATKKTNVSRIRSIICCLAVDQLMISGVDVARYLRLSPSAVSKLVSRGRGDELAKLVEADIFKGKYR